MAAVSNDNYHFHIVVLGKDTTPTASAYGEPLPNNLWACDYSPCGRYRVIGKCGNVTYASSLGGAQAFPFAAIICNLHNTNRGLNNGT